MHITTKGQVTIPLEIRESMGFLPNTEVAFHQHKNRVYLTKITQPSARSQSLLQRMKGKATVRMSTHDILALTRK